MLWYQKYQCQWIAQFWVLFFTWTMRPVGVLNFGNSSSLWPKAKRSCSQSYPQDLFASPTVGSTACTCVLDSLYSPWDDTLPHWCCPSMQQVDYERSAASTIFSQRLVLNVQNVQNAALRASEIRILPLSCESVVHCHSAPLPESGDQAYTSSHAVNERTFFSPAKGVTLRESPLAADGMSAAAQHLPVVERRRCWSILEAGFLSLIPSPYAKRPEKRWLCTRRSSFCREKRVAVEALLLVIAPFRTEAVLTILHRNDPHWPRLDSAVSNSPGPELHRVHGLARSATITCLKVAWNLHERRMRMRWNTAGIDRENVLARSERACGICRWFWNETWNF